VIGVKDLTEKVKTIGLELDGGKSEFRVLRPKFSVLTIRKAYGSDPADTNYGFEDEVFLRSFVVFVGL